MSRPALAASALLLLGWQPLVLAQSKDFTLTCPDDPEGGALLIDLRANSGTCKDLSLESADGRIRISARQAVTEGGLGLEDNTLRLTEGVRISIDDASVVADAAEVVFRDHQLISAEIHGTPVELSAFIEERGTQLDAAAEHISYDGQSGTLHVMGPTEVQLGDDHVSGGDLIYNPQQGQLRISGAQIRSSLQTGNASGDGQAAAP